MLISQALTSIILPVTGSADRLSTCLSTVNNYTSDVTGGTAPYTYTWSITNTGTNATIVANGADNVNINSGTAPGTYTLQLDITDAVGGVAAPPCTYTVTVNATPAAPVATSNSPICESSAFIPTTLNLFASAIAGATYSWTGPNGFTSALQNPSIANVTAAAAGTYSVTATVAGCTSAAGTVIVTVNPLPVITATPVPVNVCSGSAFVINLQSNIANTQFNWIRDNTANLLGMDPTGPGYTSSTVINGGLVNNTTITQTVHFAIQSLTPAGCSANPINSVATLNIYAPPHVDSITAPGNIYNLCSNSTMQLSDATPGGVWSSNNPAIASVNSSTGLVTPNAATGSVTISYMVTDGNGCTNSTTRAITINTAPSVTASASQTTICAGQSTNLSAIGPATNPVTVSFTNAVRGTFQNSDTLVPLDRSDYDFCGPSELI